MRLLFLSALRRTLHETTIGLDLARQLFPVGVRSHFVIDGYNATQLTAAGFPYTVVDPGMGVAVRTVVAEVVRKFRPDAIVLADYLAHWMTFTVTYGENPWFIDDFGVPVTAIDLYELENTSREVEILGRTMRVDNRVLRMPFVLHPVPACRPVARPGGLGRPYRANRTVRPLPPSRRREARRSLGLAKGQRLLMVPTLPWQDLMRRHAGPTTRELAGRLPQLVAHYLGQLPDDVHLLLTGPVLDGITNLNPDRVHLRSEYGAAEYDELLAVADAVWSFHVPSFALERAVHADVPGLLSVNHFDVAGPDDLAALDRHVGGLSPTVARWFGDYPGAVPAFHMWPLRWNAVLAPLLRDNPFADITRFAEVFDEESVVAGLHAVLYDTATRDRLSEARARYRDCIDALPGTAELFLAEMESLDLSHSIGRSGSA